MTEFVSIFLFSDPFLKTTFLGRGRRRQHDNTTTTRKLLILSRPRSHRTQGSNTPCGESLPPICFTLFPAVLQIDRKLLYLKVIKIRGRDSPHGVFDPWVRWDLGPDRIRSFSVVVVVTALFQKVAFLMEKKPLRARTI